jgi:hypothetical protein
VSPTQLRGVLAANIRQQAKRRGLSLNTDWLTSRMFHEASSSTSSAKRKSASIDWVAKISKALDVEPWRLFVSE